MGIHVNLNYSEVHKTVRPKWTYRKVIDFMDQHAEAISAEMIKAGFETVATLADGDALAETGFNMRHLERVARGGNSNE